MNKQIIFAAVAIALTTTTSAHAMTNQQAVGLFSKAKNGDQAALSSLISAAQGGDANAEAFLGAYYRAKGHYQQGLSWLKKAIAQNNAEGEFSLGNAYYFGQGVPQNYAKANAWTLKAAEQGFADAETDLGAAYHNGQGVPQNYAKANAWFLKAAGQGFADAETDLGAAYYNGQGVPQNYSSADYWYKKAADQGNALAEYNLGNAYANGHGIPQNYTMAYHWYKKAADKGLALAELLIGESYYLGKGMPKNTGNAVYWWKKAAAHSGHSGERAQHYLSMMGYKVKYHTHGHTSDISNSVAMGKIDIYHTFSHAENGDKIALNRLHTIAKEGNATGEFCFGDYLYNKRKKYVDAVSWFRKAAKQGNGWGEYSIGVAYYQGHGVPKNDIKALKWFNIADSHHDKADMLAEHDANIAKQKMTSSQVLVASQQGKEYINHLWKQLDIAKHELYTLKSLGISPYYVERMSQYKNNAPLLDFYHALRVENVTEVNSLNLKMRKYCSTYSTGTVSSALNRNPYKINGDCFIVYGEVKQTLGIDYGLFSSWGNVNYAIIHFRKKLTKTDLPGTNKYFAAYVVAGSPSKYKDLLGELRIVPTLYVLQAYIHRPFVPFQ